MSVDIREVAQTLLNDLESQRKDLVQVGIGVKLLYERLLEASQRDSKPDGETPAAQPAGADAAEVGDEKAS